MPLEPQDAAANGSILEARRVRSYTRRMAKKSDPTLPARRSGQPKLGDSPSPGRSPVFTVRLPEPLVAAVEAARGRAGHSRSEAARIGLELYTRSVAAAR